MEFETKIYPQIGGYGRYNRIVTLFSWFPNFAVSLNLFSDVFFTLIPESYHCKPDLALFPAPSVLGNLSRQAFLNLTVPWLKGSGFSHCELYKYPLNTSNFTGSAPRDTVPCTIGWEFAKPAGLQNNLVTEWNLVCADYWKIPLQHVCFMTGWTLGYILLGSICDWLGRRCALLLSVVFSGLLGIMACLSNSPSAFPFLRLCQGSMLAGVFLSSYIARNFIGTGIQYCFTRNLHVYSTHFYFSYALRVLTGALACVFLCVCVDRFGRRGILLLSAIVTGLSSLLLLALTQYLQGGLVLVLSVVGLLSSQALAMLSVFFGSEVMPTVVRGGTLGLIMAAGCVGMAASSLMELQNNGGYFLHHVVFSSFAVLSVLCIMLLPESKHKPLPDSLKDGERQRRPPLFLSRVSRENPPLLRTQTLSADFNRESYSRLVSATRKILAKDAMPLKIPSSTHTLSQAQAPLLACNGTAPDTHEDES
ncbi:unnamed protein product [Leuciscus chuanchicus]